MNNKPARSGKPWTNSDDKKLREMNRKGDPTKKIATALERTESAIRSRASELNVSLLPKDK